VSIQCDSRWDVSVGGYVTSGDSGVLSVQSDLLWSEYIESALGRQCRGACHVGRLRCAQYIKCLAVEWVFRE